MTSGSTSRAAWICWLMLGAAAFACRGEVIEPRAHVECTSNDDCNELGADHRCEDGYCRGSEPASPGTGGTPAGTGGTGGKPAGGGPEQICYPAYELLSQDTGETSRTCRTCDCDGSDADCTDIDCDAGIPIYLCDPDRPPVQTEHTFDVEHYSIDGDILTVEVAHGGGCEQRYTGLCFHGLEEPGIVITVLQFEHQFVGDTICDARIERTLKYDLSALGDAYLDTYGDGGLVDTNLGMYGVGELTCEERVTLSNDRVTSAIEQLDNSCETADDCVVVMINTACNWDCGAVASKASQAELEAAVAEIDAGVCSAYTEAGCPPQAQPGCPSIVPRCDNGTCR